MILIYFWTGRKKMRQMVKNTGTFFSRFVKVRYSGEKVEQKGKQLVNKAGGDETICLCLLTCERCDLDQPSTLNLQLKRGCYMFGVCGRRWLYLPGPCLMWAGRDAWFWHDIMPGLREWRCLYGSASPHVKLSRASSFYATSSQKALS